MHLEARRGALGVVWIISPFLFWVLRTGMCSFWGNWQGPTLMIGALFCMDVTLEKFKEKISGTYFAHVQYKMGQGLKMKEGEEFSINPRSHCFPGWSRFFHGRAECNLKPPSPLPWTPATASWVASLSPLLRLYSPFSIYPQRSLKKKSKSDDIISLSKVLQCLLYLVKSQLFILTYVTVPNVHALFLFDTVCHLSPLPSLHSSMLAAIFPAQPCQAHPSIGAPCTYYSAVCSASPPDPCKAGSF